MPVVFFLVAGPPLLLDIPHPVLVLELAFHQTLRLCLLVVFLFDYRVAPFKDELFVQTGASQLHLYLPITVLQSMLPLPYVGLSVVPGHPAQTAADVVFEFTLVDVAVGPLVDSVPVALVVFVLALELFTV